MVCRTIPTLSNWLCRLRHRELFPEQEVSYWAEEWKDLPRPWTVVSIGAGKFPLRFEAPEIGDLGEKLSGLGTSLIVLGSPRTGSDALDVLAKHVKDRPAKFYPWSRNATPLSGRSCACGPDRRDLGQHVDGQRGDQQRQAREHFQIAGMAVLSVMVGQARPCGVAIAAGPAACAAQHAGGYRRAHCTRLRQPPRPRSASCTKCVEAGLSACH